MKGKDCLSKRLNRKDELWRKCGSKRKRTKEEFVFSRKKIESKVARKYERENIFKRSCGNNEHLGWMKNTLIVNWIDFVINGAKVLLFYFRKGGRENNWNSIKTTGGSFIQLSQPKYKCTMLNYILRYVP